MHKPLKTKCLRRRMQSMNNHHLSRVRKQLAQPTVRVVPVMDVGIIKKVPDSSSPNSLRSFFKEKSNYNMNVARSINQSFVYNSHDYGSPNKVKNLAITKQAMNCNSMRWNQMTEMEAAASNWKIAKNYNAARPPNPKEEPNIGKQLPFEQPKILSQSSNIESELMRHKLAKCLSDE